MSDANEREWRWPPRLLEGLSDGGYRARFNRKIRQAPISHIDLKSVRRCHVFTEYAPQYLAFSSVVTKPQLQE
ncbi:hypothetical protein [Pseudomonas chlororaphis]|uniref:hypothetical protein n=1 Tax=Pseudomonas chlororaphis TaxID=587753 RepID=UPI001B305005|nr:hypothetical protein [Pseudomonas chlororaphis]MBP5057716.1 hypothetical protein [Pseudomonas chlororaphis]MBP5139541.1 hypothetical protein [Pseudomonas chlororaphis]QTU03080.1 hypothetical protein HUT26_28675 [Pseudomonas chlororaphis]